VIGQSISGFLWCMHVLKQHIRNTCKWSVPFLFEKEQQFKRNKLFLVDFNCSDSLMFRKLERFEWGTILIVVPYLGTKCSAQRILKQIAFEAELFVMHMPLYCSLFLFPLIVPFLTKHIN
jgi:hypothetical protein